MILNPWPFNWQPPRKTGSAQMTQWCRFSKRHFLLCGAERKDGRTCMGCYMRQMAITDRGNKKWILKGEEQVIHICDICGREIGKIDNIIYLEPTTREGTALMSKELCYVCAWQLLNWAGGENDILPEVPEEDVNYLFRKEDEINVTRVKPHKRTYYKRKRKAYGKQGKKKYSYSHYDGKGYYGQFFQRYITADSKKSDGELADGVTEDDSK